MKLIFHGAAREVGRSCVELDTYNGRFLLDSGLKFGPGGHIYPAVKEIEEIDAVFLSHTHLDHSGALPYFWHEGLRCEIFTTGTTKMITQLLLKDSYGIESREGGDMPYEEEDIFKVLSNMRVIGLDKYYNVNDVKFKYVNAGHVPGSAMVEIQVEGKKVLYTGDFNTIPTKLMKSCDYSDKVDVLIIESTYGDRAHPPRKQTEKKFISAVKKILGNGGNVMIPVFTVGRAQEIMMILNQERWNVPIYLDGLAKLLTRKLKRAKFEGDVKGMKSAFKYVKKIKNRKHRQKIVRSNKRAIYITTSGMVQGGPIMDYIKMLYNNKEDGILLTGYQVEGTNGRSLLDSGFAKIDNRTYYPKGHIEQFDFSAHLGLTELKRFISKVRPRHLVIQHGDVKSVLNLARIAKNELKIKHVYTPKTDQVLEI